MTREDAKALIKHKGLKYYWIAAQLGMRSNHFSDYIHGRRKLNAAQEERFHAILEMSYLRTSQ
jgi:hypothetical protein